MPLHSADPHLLTMRSGVAWLLLALLIAPHKSVPGLLKLAAWRLRRLVRTR